MKLRKTFTINDLMEGCKAGDRKMQELLYQQTSAKLFAICLRYAKDRMEAEDTLQLGFIKIFEKIKTYRGDGAFEGWMRRIMVNTAIESYRKNIKHLQLVPLEESFEQAETGVTYNNLEVQDLMKLIQQLADGYRLVFNLFAIEGFSHKEIAESLGITEGASKSQLSRARTILKEKITKMEGMNYAKSIG